MKPRKTVLVVAPTACIRDALVKWLDEQRYQRVVVDQFVPAKLYLDLGPDLVIAEVRLGEYNGVHLALRAQGKAIPAVVIGDPDAVLEADAAALGAAYVHPSALTERLPQVVPSLLQAALPRRPTRTIAWLDDAVGARHRAAWELDARGAGKKFQTYH